MIIRKQNNDESQEKKALDDILLEVVNGGSSIENINHEEDNKSFKIPPLEGHFKDTQV